MRKKISFTNRRRQKIVGTLFAPRRAARKQIVILCHGFRSSKETDKAAALAKALNRLGTSLLAFDFTGRGESDGKFEDSTVSKYIADLDAAVTWAAGRYKKIGVIGSSLGGLVALNAAVRDRRIAALGLLSPVSFFPWRRDGEFSKKSLAQWRTRGWVITVSDRFGPLKLKYSFYRDALKYRSYSRYPRVAVPVVIVHGTEDKSVPLSQSRKLVRTLPRAVLFKLKGADHRSTNARHKRQAVVIISSSLAGMLSRAE